MEHGAAASFLILLIDGWQRWGVEMTPLERPEGWSRSDIVGSTSAFGSGCVFLTGSLVHTGGCANTGVVHTGIVATAIVFASIISGRMTIRFPAVDEHTVPG